MFSVDVNGLLLVAAGVDEHLHVPGTTAEAYTHNTFTFVHSSVVFILYVNVLVQTETSEAFWFCTEDFVNSPLASSENQTFNSNILMSEIGDNFFGEINGS